MELTRDDLPSYYTLVRKPPTPEQLAKLEAEYRDNKRRWADTRVAKDDQGAVIGVVNVAVGGEGTFLLTAYGSNDAAATLLAEAVAHACERGAQRMGMRVTGITSAFRAAALAARFQDLGDRIEYQADVASLPTDEGSPLSWRTAGDDAATLLRAVAEGDPHGKDERETPDAMLASFLGAPLLRSEPECVQIGSLDGSDVAFVCAQVAPKDGWSRITYMGLVPDARRRGLGVWVHRKGFCMLREQGGKLYHGGTAATNKGMIALFEQHGCRVFKRMTEFGWPT